MLQGNLDKVVQHGKRADSIVKNMLLHSREGSGNTGRSTSMPWSRRASISPITARGPRNRVSISPWRESFDPAAGEVDLFPQEITRVLLNLISNGFYAAIKRKAEADEDSYEPILAAATRNLGDRVEISDS